MQETIEVVETLVEPSQEENIELLKEKLSDKRWRMDNLYFIRDANGDKVKFCMNEEQEQLFNEMHYQVIIPKARQLGITTFFCIYYLDEVLFSSYKVAGIIAHRREDSKKIFRDKIKFAWDNLPGWVRHSIGDPKTDTAQELSFPHDSMIFVSTSTRGGTINYLHISEFGYICTHAPEKAEEIVTGAINSVHAGQMVSIESTAKGRGGPFHEFCLRAKKLADEGTELSPLDMKLFFFPWWKKPQYALNGSKTVITDEWKKYFFELEYSYDIHLTDAQKRWYISKYEMNKDRMFNEYPSTFDECFKGSVDGAYYGREMTSVYKDQRIRAVPYDARLPVQTFWDLGMNDSNTIIFTQAYGNEVRIIDYYENHNEGLAHYVKHLKEKDYTYEYHFLPHDVEVRELGTGMSRRKVLEELGLYNVRVGKKAGVSDGIEKVRTLLSRCYFDVSKTEPLYTALANYRKEFDEELGVYKDKPLHNKYSHAADAMRLLASNWEEDMVAVSGSNESYEQNFFAS